MLNKSRTPVALRVGVGLFVFMAGCGAGVGVLAQSGALTATTAKSALSSETPASATDPGGTTGGGGAVPVVPAAGACIIGLNCGCIRGITCPGTIPHHHHAPGADHPDAPAGPDPGPGGGG